MAPCTSQEKCGGCPANHDKDCLAEDSVRLSNYGPGERGRVFQVCGDSNFRRRMMEMGFVRGTEVKVVKYAPLNDPIEFVIKGYHITLRRAQAQDILMSLPEKAA